MWINAIYWDQLYLTDERLDQMEAQRILLFKLCVAKSKYGMVSSS